MKRIIDTIKGEIFFGPKLLVHMLGSRKGSVAIIILISTRILSNNNFPEFIFKEDTIRFLFSIFGALVALCGVEMHTGMKFSLIAPTDNKKFKIEEPKSQWDE